MEFKIPLIKLDERQDRLASVKKQLNKINLKNLTYWLAPYDKFDSLIKSAMA